MLLLLLLLLFLVFVVDTERWGHPPQQPQKPQPAIGKNNTICADGKYAAPRFFLEVTQLMMDWKDITTIIISHQQRSFIFPRIERYSPYQQALSTFGFAGFER
jgi:hypothetical protein